MGLCGVLLALWLFGPAAIGLQAPAPGTARAQPGSTLYFVYERLPWALQATLWYQGCWRTTPLCSSAKHIVLPCEIFQWVPGDVGDLDPGSHPVPGAHAASHLFGRGLWETAAGQAHGRPCSLGVPHGALLGYFPCRSAHLLPGMPSGAALEARCAASVPRAALPGRPELYRVYGGVGKLDVYTCSLGASQAALLDCLPCCQAHLLSELPEKYIHCIYAGLRAVMGRSSCCVHDPCEGHRAWRRVYMAATAIAPSCVSGCMHAQDLCSGGWKMGARCDSCPPSPRSSQPCMLDAVGTS